MNLTSEQKQAVELTGHNILVSAGAGTGKTRVLVERFLHFVTTGHAAVTEILALTFTEKAANEMKRRILERFKELGMEEACRELESAYISTIHAFCARVLREHPLEAGIDPAFHVIESEKSEFLMEQALEEAMEGRCHKGSETFELLRTYGEATVRKGILEIFRTARHAGLYLKEFVRPPRPSGPALAALAQRGDMLLRRAGERGLAAEWDRFVKKRDWEWADSEAFLAWSASFSRRGGKNKNKKGLWQEITEVCREFHAWRIEGLMTPWVKRLEELALFFEELYERKKQEKSFLDFDDLQMRATRLFKKEGKIHNMLREQYRKKFRHILIDEFQDTNPLQLELVEILSQGQNLFFVGDFKQSIYAFRGAEPQLFLEKDALYRERQKGVRLALTQNFRASENVLTFINEFFKALWEEDNIPFEQLVRRSGLRGGKAELIRITAEEGETLDLLRLREAEVIAERILDFHKEGVAFGDMCLLMRAATRSGIYEQALKKRGIPYHAISGGGFYHQPEIRDMISYLSFLENPLADIPLAASLRSPLFQIGDDTLFWLARYAKSVDGSDKTDETGEDIIQRERPLYEGIKRLEEITEIGEETKKRLLFFRNLSEELLRVKDRLKIHELLDLILARTSYELVVLADPQGVRRYANLKKLIGLAREYETSEPLSLGAFLRILKRLEIQETQEAEAQIEAEESGDVVRIMTVHKAKGLEFEVVFVADLGRELRCETGTILADPQLGLAMKVPQGPWPGSLKAEPRLWQEIRDKITRKNKEEWKRLLYVAATRAKKRLVLSGAFMPSSKFASKKSFYEMTSWMDWLMAVPEGRRGKLACIDARPVAAKRRRKALAEKRNWQNLFENFEPVPDERIIRTKKQRERIAARCEEILRCVEPSLRAPARAIDLPVSAFMAFAKSPDLYRDVYEIGYAEGWPEEALREEPVGSEERTYARDFGTAVHGVLERLDFRHPQAQLGEVMDEVFCHASDAERAEAEEIIRHFLETPLFHELKRAKILKKEIPFVLNERHGLIQGVIDVLFQDGRGAWHVVDYKTAVGDPALVKEARYDLQIALYALAVREILGEGPRWGVLHFLRNHWTYRQKLDEKSLKAAQYEIRELQKEILAYRSQRKIER